MPTKKISQMSRVERENLREIILIEFSDFFELKMKLGQLRSQIRHMTNDAYLLEEKLIYLEDNVSAVIETCKFDEKKIQAELEIRRKRENLEKRIDSFTKQIQELYPS